MTKLVMATTLAALALPAVAQAQQAASTSSSTAGPTAPAAAAAPAPAPAAPAAPRAAPLFWRQSLINFTVSANLNSFAPALQLTPNRTVDMSLSLRPRFTLSRMFQVRAGLDLRYEFTNSDTTSTINEARFGDPFVDLWITGIPAVGPFKFWVAPRLQFPVSPESRAATTILTTGLVLQAAVGVEHFLGGDLTLIAQGSYTHNFNQYTTPGTRTEFSPNCFSGLSCLNQVSGVANAADVLSWAVIVAPSWGHWSPGLFFRMTHAFPYSLRSLEGLSNVGEAPSRVRQSTFFAAWVDYNANPWLSLELGYSMGRNLLRADGRIGNPIWDEAQDMRVYVSTVFTVDKLYQALSGNDRGSGGVIRTENTPRRGPASIATF
jgi:hypothetical protein